MARDVFDPGPDGLYLFAPRDANGAPAYSNTHSAADVVYPVPGAAPLTRTTTVQRDASGRKHAIRIWAPDIPTVPLPVLRAKLAEYLASE
jgi:hypothetical protein